MSIGGATLVGGPREIKINTPGAQELDLIGTGLKMDFEKKKKIVASEKNKKDIQHSRFPCSPLPKY